MQQWLLDLYDVFLDQLTTSGSTDARLNPSLLPGWAYARVLALKLMESTAEGKVG
jgi:hypothetical protein